MDGATGPPGAGVIALGFSYAPFDEADDAPGITTDSDVPSRLQDIPFGGFTGTSGDAGTDTFVAASRSQRQCITLANTDAASDATLEASVPISLYSYMAFGGDSPSYGVSVTGSGDDAVPMDEGHGFFLKADDGIEMLYDHDPDNDMFTGDNGPNLASGDYTWELHVMDDSGSVMQMDRRPWKVRIRSTEYQGPNGATTEDEDATSDADADPGIEDWADFLSSNFEPSPFNLASNREAPSAHVTEGAVKSVDLAETDSELMANMESDTDIDVIYLGPLTPHAVLDVKVNGTTEGSVTHDFNEVSVALYRHIPNQAQGDPIASVASETEDFMTEGVAYKDLDCGFYYLAVSGEEGEYTLTWNAAGLNTT